MSAATIVTVGGTTYTGGVGAGTRTAAGFQAIDELTMHIDEGYDTLVFTIFDHGTLPPWTTGTPVSLSINGTTVFNGDIDDFGTHQTNMGWAMQFRSLGLKKRADYVPVLGLDGTGIAAYNRSPTDPLYSPSLAGQSVGQIIASVLKVVPTATTLNALGIGAYTSLTPPTLPAQTVTDLAALTVVPPTPVLLQGQNVYNACVDLCRNWHPKYVLWMQPDGTIRATNLFTMTANAFVIPNEAGAADTVTWPTISRDTADCYTQVQIIGQSIVAAVCSLQAGTLAIGWTSGQQSAWNITAFTQPTDSYDRGNLSSVTTSSCTVTSDFSTAFWATNFWTGRQGYISLVNPAGTGIFITDTRFITSNGALTAGGSASVTWDSTTPLDSLSFTRYVIMGESSPEALVGRSFLIRDPNTGATGVSTYVGSHLELRFPFPTSFSNNTGYGGGAGGLTTTAVANIFWSKDGNPPYISFPATIQVDQSLGGVIFTEPVVKPLAPPNVLANGWPASFSQGLYFDVQVVVPYNRGGMVAQAPSSGFSGTAFSVDGISRVLTLPIPAFNYLNLTANMVTLANEYLAVFQDAIVEGSISYRTFPTAFNPLVFPYALSLTTTGTTNWFDGLNLPVRSVTLKWPQGSGIQHQVDFQFSNRHRPFQGQDLYLRPLPGFSGDGHLSLGQGDQFQGGDYSGLANLPPSISVPGDGGDGQIIMPMPQPPPAQPPSQGASSDGGAQPSWPSSLGKRESVSRAKQPKHANKDDNQAPASEPSWPGSMGKRDQAPKPDKPDPGTLSTTPGVDEQTGPPARPTDYDDKKVDFP
jgi:hypothetical protein